MHADPQPRILMRRNRSSSRGGQIQPIEPCGGKASVEPAAQRAADGVGLFVDFLRREVAECALRHLLVDDLRASSAASVPAPHRAS